MGALRGVEVGADDQQALREVLGRLKLKEACAVVADARGPFAVLQEGLLCDHVGEVRGVAQVVLEGAEKAVVCVVGQGAVPLPRHVGERRHVREQEAFIG